MALVITELDVGGAEKALVALATGLDRGRWAPGVVALGPEGPMAEPLRAAGVPVRCLDGSPRRPLRSLARLIAALRELGPELLQSFLFHANVAARLAAPWAGRPWVLGGLRVAEREKEWHLAVDALTCRLAAGSACVSEGVRRHARDVGRIPPERLVVIPNGIDPAPFDRATPVDRAAIGVPAEAPFALFVGRLERQKGVDVLLDAAAIIAPKRPDWHLVLAGEGPLHKQMNDRIEADSRLAGRVHLLGMRGDVPRLMKAASLLVLPSLWEGMPNVVLEAMAAGLPIVATAVEGAEDLVRPGRNGWLVPPGDPDALASALLDAAGDAARLRAFGEEGRRRVEEEFAIGSVVAAYDRLWSAVLGYE